MSTPVDTLEKINEEPKTWRRGGSPLIIAHRGAAAELPENTLEAFELAWRQGADGIEFDVQLSSDDVPVVIHDPCLDRTTSGCGRVRNYAAKDLKRLDAGSWFNERYPSKTRPQNTGLRIPLLAEALEWVQERNCRAFVEIKDGGTACSGIEARVLEAICQARVLHQTTVISFDLAVLKRCRELDPSIALGIDFPRPLHALSKARSISAVSVHPHWMFMSSRSVACIHRAGFQVLVWGLDSETPITDVMKSEVDGLMTDRPASAVELRAAMWARSPVSGSGARGRWSTDL
ncbi:MAG TPA: glycerophosphodiester phosphodiesterase family protein [Terriglobia bacterium]|nr:glycerophosphodiester phosphodiesterase family protein [Terriglobia bacterium]